MSIYYSNPQNPLGLNSGRAEKVRVILRNGAASEGHCCVFDIAASDGEVTATLQEGGTDSPTVNVLKTDGTIGKSDNIKTVHFYCILAEDIAENAEGWAYIRGNVKALLGETTGAGDGVAGGSDAGGELMKTSNGERVIGICLETGANATLSFVIFDGVNGFGWQEAVA